MITKIACVGDSITYGTGVIATRKRNSYPAKLNALLGDGYCVQNYGLRGRTLQNEGDKPYCRENAFAKSKELLPDIVLVMLGTNDSKAFNWDTERYRLQLEQFVDTYEALASNPQVYLLTCCATFCMNGKAEVAYDIDGAVIENEIRHIIIQLGNKKNIPVIDLYHVTKDHPEYFMDGVHPNTLGNQAIAEAVFKSIYRVNTNQGS